MKQLYLLLLFVTLMSACGSGSNETINRIDYSTLDSLGVKKALEIGKSGNYLPGQLSGLVVTSNADILVADWGSTTIEQFDAEGNHVATVARKGNGPGEIDNRFFSIKDIGYDTLMVGSFRGRQSYFAEGENGIFQFIRATVAMELPNRRLDILGPQSDSTYFATTSILNRNMEEATKNNEDYHRSPLVIINKSGNIYQDSVHTLKKSNPHVTQAGQGQGGVFFRMRPIPYRYEDQFVLLENGNYLIARPDSSVINFYNSNQQLQRSIPLNVASRPITDEDLEYHLGDMSHNIRNEIEARLHETKPPYLNIWATENHIWLNTDTGKEGKKMVVLDYEGNAIGKFVLPEIDSIEQIRGNKVYTIHHNPEKGDMIRVYQINI